MKTSVAVVVPNWNGKTMLVSCLKSLKMQSIKPIIIVVDNASLDGSVEEVEKKYPDVILIKNSENLGFSGGVNVGIQYCIKENIDYVVLLNNDTRVEKNWLESLANKIDEKNKCGIIASKVIQKDSKLIDNTGESFSVWGFPFPRSRNSESSEKPILPLFGASGGSTLYSVKMLQQIGLFDEDFFAYYEDADINFRARLAGWGAVYAENAVAYHAIGGTSGKVGGFTMYHTLKNLPWLIIKNIPIGLLPRVLPRFVLLYTLIYLKALLSRYFLLVIKAGIVSLFFMPKKLVQRYKVQSSRGVSSQYISSLFVNSLPPNSSLGKFRIFKGSSAKN